MLEEPKEGGLCVKSFTIDLEKVGGQCIDVQEGQKIHLMSKASIEGQGSVKFYYGYNGSNFNNIEGQEVDFEVQTSEHNEYTSCRDFGQYPFIYYSK
jgi:hypothetical protein